MWWWQFSHCESGFGQDLLKNLPVFKCWCFTLHETNSSPLRPFQQANESSNTIIFQVLHLAVGFREGFLAFFLSRGFIPIGSMEVDIPSLKLTANAPENRPLEKEIPDLETTIFRCKLLVSGRVYANFEPQLSDYPNLKKQRKPWIPLKTFQCMVDIYLRIWVVYGVNVGKYTKTNSSPPKMGHSKRKRSYSNHPFSGASC